MSTRPPSIVTTLGLVRHPVGLATPDRTAARGQALDATAGRPSGSCPRAAVW